MDVQKTTSPRKEPAIFEHKATGQDVVKLDGRFVYLASRDGWITKYDLYGLRPVAEVRAGINTRNLAVSGDGSVVAVANYLPATLVVLDAHDLGAACLGDGARSVAGRIVHHDYLVGFADGLRRGQQRIERGADLGRFVVGGNDVGNHGRKG